ncbi:hypothetical protein XU18_3825 [Perkinsela sp. CCAP 1560/4]|nr:hypothetical protein XU18_3825 [Perkinsela sp. CCAP 1560/4]|eukprot:KNH05097.1 hypothetical protein XU18_3825 [Perkinsela sp. CCAP 1560/4]
MRLTIALLLNRWKAISSWWVIPVPRRGGSQIDWIKSGLTGSLHLKWLPSSVSEFLVRWNQLTANPTMRLATRKDKIRAKGYTFQRYRRSLLADDIESESLRFQLIQPLCEAWSALPENGHAEMSSFNGEFEVGGAVYATGLYACMRGMDVSFLGMSHSRSNLYSGVHVILCGQDRGVP